MHGHPDAGDYPIAMVFDEASLVVDHLNRQQATLGVVIQAATATTGMAAGREANALFRKLVESLNGESSNS